MKDPDFFVDDAGIEGHDVALTLSKDLADADIAIVGLGLMGASLAGALRGHCRAVIGVSRRPETIETALSRNLVDWGTTDLIHGVRNADVVVLAAPVRVILRLLSEIGCFLQKGCLLLDLGSTKAEIVARMASLPGHVQPVGGHPMCGKETSGIAAADPMLYQGCTFVLTPLTRTSEAALALSCTLIRVLGARPLILDADRHDRLVATTSHLPYLLACALVGAAIHASTNDPRVWDVAASGFRDTSRLAGSDVKMMLDILFTNRDAVLKALDAFSGQLRDLASYLEARDETGLRTALAAVRKRRAGQ